MGKPTLTVIQGGKSGETVDPVRAFFEAGLASEDGLLDYNAIFERLDALGPQPVQQTTSVAFIIDDSGEEHFRFL